jgi:hypothetical protein
MRWMVDRAMLHHHAKEAAARHEAYIARLLAAQHEWMNSLSGERRLTHELITGPRPPRTHAAVLPQFLEAHPEYMPFEGFDPTNPEHFDPQTGFPVPTDVTPALDTESEISPGSLYASGLIAAGGIIGLLGVCVKLYEAATDKKVFQFTPQNPFYHDWIAILMFAALAYSLYYFARKPLDTHS